MKLPSGKLIVELLKKGATVEAQEQIMALREAALELQEENLDLKEEVKTLSQQFELKAKVKFEKKAYWLDDKGKIDGPFCQRCYDVDKKLLRLQPKTVKDGAMYADGAKCMECKSEYVDWHKDIFGEQ